MITGTTEGGEVAMQGLIPVTDHKFQPNECCQDHPGQRDCVIRERCQQDENRSHRAQPPGLTILRSVMKKP